MYCLVSPLVPIVFLIMALPRYFCKYVFDHFVYPPTK